MLPYIRGRFSHFETAPKEFVGPESDELLGRPRLPICSRSVKQVR